MFAQGSVLVVIRDRRLAKGNEHTRLLFQPKDITSGCK